MAVHACLLQHAAASMPVFSLALGIAKVDITAAASQDVG